MTGMVETEARATPRGQVPEAGAGRVAPGAETVIPDAESSASAQPAGEVPEPARDKVALVVLGMHRSGTSALARLLSLAGAALPEQMIGAGEGNETGHWEPRRIALVNDGIMTALDHGWLDWRRLDLELLPVADRRMFRRDIRSILADEYGDAPLIVLKEPRICRMVGTYVEALQDLGYRVVPVIIYRNPLEVIDSLMARSSWPAGRTRLDAALLWLVHVLEAEAASRGLQRVFVAYEDLFGGYPQLLETLADEAGIAFPVPCAAMCRQADEFLDPGRKHQRRKLADLSSEPLALGWLRRAFDALRLLSADPRSRHAEEMLDQVRAGLQSALPMLAASAEERDRARREGEEAVAAERGRLAALQQQHDALDRRLDETQKAVVAEREHKSRIEAALAEREDQIGALRGEIDRLDRLRGTLEERSAGLDRQLDESRRAVEAERDHRSRIETLLADREGQIGTLHDEILRLGRLREQAGRRIADLEAQLHDGPVMGEELFRLRTQEHEREKAALLAEIEALMNSRSWRVTAPLRGVRSASAKVRRRLGTARAMVSARGGLLSTSRAALGVMSREGFRGLRQRFDAGHAARLAPVMLHHSQEARTDFVNSVARRRRDVLMSGWHRALTHAVWDDSPLPADGPTLGLSLVTFNSARWLPGFFESLRAQAFPLKRLNVVFVDHGSTDDTLRLIEAEREAHGDRFASFQLHERPNLGFGAGHDHAIRQCRDEFVLVSNVDVEFHASTITRLWRAAVVDEGDIASWEVRQCPHEHPRYYDPVTLEPSWSSHACILLRRRAYEQVGGYEQKIFMYGEDVELSYRLRGHGWRLRYLPQIAVTHFVDFHDTTLRPHQLTGSIAANVLLRHRYGGPASAAEGEALLARITNGEGDARRRGAFAGALAKIEEDRAHFAGTHRPVVPAAFPFRGFDYDIVRDGHDVALQSARPAGNLPLVSIVTRTHGDKLGLLSEAIASVINQSYPNIEHIIVEDRTDFAGPLVARAREAYGRDIRYLKSDGAGRSRAGNFGLENARGEYLMFLDNDDLLFGDHVELLVREMIANPDHVAAYALGWDVRTEFLPDGHYREVSHSTPEGHRLPFSRARLRDMNFIPIQCILFSRGVYEAEGGFAEDIDHLEDWNLWSRYARHGEFGFVRKLTSLYRTPHDEAVRLRRQGELNAAYDRVRKRNLEA